MSSDIFEYQFDDGFEHHGVKGQKWGIRKSRISSGRKKSGRGFGKKDDVKKLSDNELNKRLDRLRKEKQYKEMMRPSAVNTLMAVGKVVVTGVIGGAATKVAKKYVSGYMDEAVENLLKERNIHIPVSLTKK